MVNIPDMSDVAAAMAAKLGSVPPAQEFAGGVGGCSDDERVEHDDVAHCEERGEPSTHFATYR